MSRRYIKFEGWAEITDPPEPETDPEDESSGVMTRHFFCEDGVIKSPDGTVISGGGMNVSFNLTSFPFVFHGVQGGDGVGGGAFDVWTGPKNRHKGQQVYPGGGVNSGEVYSPQLGREVRLPGRWYAINGYGRDQAIKEGLCTVNGTDWGQKAIRPTLVARGEDNIPPPLEIAANTVEACREAVQAGLVVMPELHDHTGRNLPINHAYDTPASKLPSEYRDVVAVWDTLVSEFKEEPRFWINPTNEPISGHDTVAREIWADQIFFWVRRIREYHGAGNLICMDLPEWGQDLHGLALGEYDDILHDLGDDSLVLGWHAYGARPRVGGYTLESMDADLRDVRKRGHTVLVGEYGQAAQLGQGNAGPDHWNREAVQYLTSDGLAEKHGLLCFVWHATGDSSFWHTYKLAAGPQKAKGDGLSTPFWDVESRDDPKMEELGRLHWDFSTSVVEG